MRWARCAACLGAGLLIPLTAGSAQRPSAEELLERLESAARHLDTLQAEFVQSLHSLALGTPQRESGVLYVQRPGRMRWEYRQPEEKLAVVDGRRSWLYVPAEAQVFVGDLDEAERGGITTLLLGTEPDLGREFEVRLLTDEDGNQVPDSLSLLPRRGSDEFERIDLTLSDSGLPSVVVVQGVLGDVMEYRLSHVRTGVALDPALFRFVPPEGVELVPVE